MSDWEWEWPNVVTEYTPPTGPPPRLMQGHSGFVGDSRPAVIKFSDSYESSIRKRFDIVKRYESHPAIDAPKLFKLMDNVSWAKNADAASLCFEMFEIEIGMQLDQLSYDEFSGPNNDATAEDIAWRYNED